MTTSSRDPCLGDSQGPDNVRTIASRANQTLSYRSNLQVGPADVPKQRRLGLRSVTDGALFWGGTIAIGLSTAVLLAVLSRHLHHQGFSSLSTLIALFFVASLIPSGIPLRSAALEVDGAPRMNLTRWHYAALVGVGALVSPVVAYLLHLPVLSVMFVAAQVVVTIPLANRRGVLIAAHRFDAMGANLFLESWVRVTLGIVGGLLWGLNGVAVALAVATGIALLTVPTSSVSHTPTHRRITSMFHTWLALVLLGLLVQMDIFLAPSVMSHAAATKYDVAALTSRAVYLVLVAISTLIFPYVRVHARRRTVVLSAAATLAIGLALTLVLVALRHLIGTVLEQDTASLAVLIALGAAMSVAGATGVVINGGIALGVARPWPPLLFGIAGVVAFGMTRPSPLAFSLVVLASQVVTLGLTAQICLRRPRDRSMEPIAL